MKIGIMSSQNNASNPGGGGAFVPTDITGLDLWLNEDGYSGADTDPVSTWTDQSGSGNNASQATGANQPSIAAAALNGLDVLDWDVGIDYMTIPKTSWGANVTLFAVVKKSSGSSVNGAIFDCATNISFGSSKGLRFDRFSSSFRLGVAGVSSGNGSFASLSDTDTDWEILIATYDGATMALFKEGATGPTSTAESGAIDYTGVVETLIGAHIGPDNEFGGQISTVGCYNSALSTGDRQKVEGYLAHHYGLTALLDAGHPYKSTPP